MKKIIISLISALTLAAGAGAQGSGIAIVAHRGFWNCEEGGFSHNSIASLKAAQNAGFWGSEFDVHMTADEVLLVYHDNDIEGKAIDSYSYNEFSRYRLPNGEEIPTFDEYVAQFKAGPECVMVLEVKGHKTPEMENRCIELILDKLRGADMLSPEKVIFISFSMNACKTLAAKLPGYTVQYLEKGLTPKDVWNHGVNGIDSHERTFIKWHPEYVKDAHALGMSVNIWTVNEPEAIYKAIELGVDQITTNEPLLVRDLLKKTKVNEIR